MHHALVSERILIVDDNEAFRLLAQRMLERAGFDVVGAAADGESALAQIERLGPDVVLLDIQLPILDGFDVAERLARQPEAPAVVLTSSRDRDDYGTRIIDSKVAGFIPKAELTGDALRRLVSGR
jgi:CheY-like chemotaxis protein